MPGFGFLSNLRARVGALAAGLLLAGASHSLAAQQLAPPRARTYTRPAHLMGSAFTFTAVSADDSLAWRALREAQRIDHLCS